MQYLNFEKASPHFNLALEEVLLQPHVKLPDQQAILRVWRNKRPCIVIGRGEKYEQQVHVENIRKDQLPVIRRVSGGGTVLHGPDNINLSFFLPMSYHSELKGLTSSYQLILGWVKLALSQSHNIELDIKGTCDLAIYGKKFSGTAQARKRHGILHHMTLLLHADYESMERYLQEPSKRPDYREKRTHRDFVIGLKDQYSDFRLDRFLDSLKNILRVEQNYDLKSEFIEKAELLATEKYKISTWNEHGRLN